MSRAALAKSAEFTWDRSIDTLECILREAIAQGGSTTGAMTRAAAAPALVDARWLGIGGPGRVAEHLLQGLHELEPPGDVGGVGPRRGRSASVAGRGARRRTVTTRRRSTASASSRARGRRTRGSRTTRIISARAGSSRRSRSRRCTTRSRSATRRRGRSRR